MTTLISLLGDAASPGAATFGMFDGGGLGSDLVGVACIQGTSTECFAAMNSVLALSDWATTHVSVPSIGAFLVRPVPEPATALLLACGLAGLAATRRHGGGNARP